MSEDAENRGANPWGEWVREDDGFYMATDESEAGRLVRLVRVVLWTMRACNLPRAPAVEVVCDALQAADPAPRLFQATTRMFAVPVKGLDFGLYTWRRYERDQTQLVNPTERPPNLRRVAPGDVSIGINATFNDGFALPPEPHTVPDIRKLWREFFATVKPVHPGAQAAAVELRRLWGALLLDTQNKERGNLLGGVDFLNHPALPYRHLSVSATDAGRIWGWRGGAARERRGAPRLLDKDPAPTLPAMKNRTRDDLLRPLIGRVASAMGHYATPAAVFSELRRLSQLADSDRPQPLLGATEDGIQWLDANDSPKTLNLASLRKRLARLDLTKTPRGARFGPIRPDKDR